MTQLDSINKQLLSFEAQDDYIDISKKISYTFNIQGVRFLI